MCVVSMFMISVSRDVSRISSIAIVATSFCASHPSCLGCVTSAQLLFSQEIHNKLSLVWTGPSDDDAHGITGKRQ